MKFFNFSVAAWKLVARYPAVSAGLFQIIVIVGAHFGLHLTTGQLTTVAGTIAGVFAILVHMGVIPVAKVANVKAGLVPTVPPDVAVATVEINAKPVSETPKGL